VKQPGLPELLPESARSAAGPRDSAGGVDKTPWSFLWEKNTICAPSAGEAAMAPSITAQGITRQRAGAAVTSAELFFSCCGSVAAPRETGWAQW